MDPLGIKAAVAAFKTPFVRRWYRSDFKRFRAFVDGFKVEREAKPDECKAMLEDAVSAGYLKKRGTITGRERAAGAGRMSASGPPFASLRGMASRPPASQANRAREPGAAGAAAVSEEAGRRERPVSDDLGVWEASIAGPADGIEHSYAVCVNCPPEVAVEKAMARAKAKYGPCDWTQWLLRAEWVSEPPVQRTVHFVWHGKLERR